VTNTCDAKVVCTEEQWENTATNTCDSCSITGSTPSTILENGDECMVINWMGSKPNLALLYRVSNDGDDASVFHEKCDGKSNTLTVIKS
jgi:hypothetical protein